MVTLDSVCDVAEDNNEFLGKNFEDAVCEAVHVWGFFVGDVF